MEDQGPTADLTTNPISLSGRPLEQAQEYNYYERTHWMERAHQTSPKGMVDVGQSNEVKVGLGRTHVPMLEQARFGVETPAMQEKCGQTTSPTVR
ncbi:unnamed protein product, partial [Iphiclides podalirius]